MMRLLGAVSWLVRWVVRSPRRLVGLLAVPALVIAALLAGPISDREPAGGSGEALAGGRTGAAPATGPTSPRPTGLPGTTGPATPVPSRPTPTLAAAQQAAAIGYVTTANSHDARPGRDRSFTDSYRRTGPYVTPELLRLVSEESRRGDYEWSQWLREQATVRVEVVATGVPDGAPAPTATTAYARVQFRQIITPTVAGATARTTDGAVNLLLSRTGDGWLVSRLLADT
jgi:hypothetical protein